MGTELFEVIVDEILDHLRGWQRLDAAALRRECDALAYDVPAKFGQLRNFDVDLINSDGLVTIGRDPDPLAPLARGERVAAADVLKFESQLRVDPDGKQRGRHTQRKFRLLDVRRRFRRPELDFLFVGHRHDGAAEARHPDGPDLRVAENKLRNRINVAKSLPELSREAIPDVDAGVERRRHQRRRVVAELTRDDRGQVTSQLEKLLFNFSGAHPVNVDGRSGSGCGDQMTSAGPVEAMEWIFVSLCLAHVVVQPVLEVPNLKNNYKVLITMSQVSGTVTFNICTYMTVGVGTLSPTLRQKQNSIAVSPLISASFKSCLSSSLNFPELFHGFVCHGP